MKENNKNLPGPALQEPVPFKGYTMEELRYQRAMMALRKEFCKTKVLQSVQALRPGSRNEGKTSGKSKFALAGKIASAVFSHMNTLDYVLMGISLFGTAKKGLRLFRGKK